MNIRTKQFQLLTDINLAWDFMVDVYAPGFANGVAAPFFEYAVSSSWMDKSYLHLCRFWLDGDKVVAFVFSESPVTTVFFNLRPGYEHLAGELIDYAERYMPDFDGEQDFVLFPGQTALIDEATRRGYRLVHEGMDYVFDFGKSQLDYKLPEGFHFVAPADVDPVKLAVCTWKGFDHEDKGPFVGWTDRDPGTPWNPVRAYNGILGPTIAPPPHATHENNVIIANEAGDYVCFSGMWWVEKNRLAYMEPLCTIPEYRGRGLAAAALSEHYRKFKPLGAEYMTGGEGEFYRRIGYTPGIYFNRWKKG